MSKGKTRIITYGTFDMFHIGHLNILKRAKEFGDYLIVGVTSEDYDRSRGKLNVVESLEKRVETIKELDWVDEVIVEHHKGQKIVDMKKYNIDKFIIGDDWVGKFDYLNEYCEVVYLPRTKGISSTQLRQSDKTNIKIGIIGHGRIASRFIEESKYISHIEISSLLGRKIEKVEKFIKDNGILYGFDNIKSFLKSDIQAIYIATPHGTHFDFSKQCLEAGKHVLCEKPATLNHKELKQLLEIAEKNNLVFLEAIKTAFCPAFNKLIEEINNGIIGDVIEIKSTFTKLIYDKSQREWKSKNGGATNELATYPLLLAEKILGKQTKTIYLDTIDEDTKNDSCNTIIGIHKNGNRSISSIGIGMKSEGNAVIGGTKGYIYIPAPWWLTKEFFIRFEDINKEIKLNYIFEGDGLRYELSEFIGMIKRGETKSNRLTYKNMLNINKIISNYNQNDK